MQRRSFLMASGCSLLIGTRGALRAALAEGKKHKDRVVGTIWEYRLKSHGKKENGQFRMNNYEIFKGAQKIGDGIRKDDDEAKLIITGYPPLNGTAVMRKVRHSPPFWKGTLVKDDGSTWTMEADVKEK
jgi:hypothetical protein